MILEDILERLKNSKQDKAYTEKYISYTYEELYKFVCNIYNFLIENNKEKKPVIIYGNKQVYMKAAFLACSFAGIAYVPIDSSTPSERVNLIINQVKPHCIIGDYDNSPYKNISTIKINNIMENNDYKNIEKIHMKPEDIYYIIFTSGTTGIPKGVQVTYNNLNSCIKWLEKITKIQKGVILNQAVFSFDLSVADLYLSLVSGSEHYILEDTTKLDFKSIFKGLKESKCTLAVMTPSFADLLLTDKTFNKQLLPKLNTIIFCGEKLFSKTIEKLYERFLDLNIINSYGPTECTFAVTSIKLTRKDIQKENIPVGRPKEDTEIVILDEDKNALEDSNIGEILIVGESVSAGYLEGLENNSFMKYNEKKAYLTGDLGFLKNGILYCIGRKDNQVKYRGYRIELSDIENNFYNLEYVDKVKVITKLSKNNVITKLIAFLKLKEGIELSEGEIKNDISKKVPSYMVPTIKIIEEMPLTNNGKIDINKLRSMK